MKIRKLRQQKPMITPRHDIKLLQHVQGRYFPRMKQLFHITKILSPRERALFRISFAVLIVALAWLGVLFAKNYRIYLPAVGGQYMEAIVGAPKLVNPIFAPLNDVDMDITRLVYSGLMRIDKKQRLIPDLAVSYDISEDKKVYTFSLRQDVLWHDSERFTAQDVVFTVKTIQNAEVNSPLLVSFQGVQIEAKDEYTVQFTLVEPFAPFLSSLTVGILPEHVWADVAPERMMLAQKNLQPIGTGPFAFKKLLKNEDGFIYRYNLARFGEYYRQAPYIEEFEFHFFNEYDGDAGAINAIRRQTVDGLHFVPNDLRDQVERKHIVLHTLQLPQYTALFFNQDKQPFLEDKNVREALAYSLDKERILRESLRGEGQVIYSPILPGFPGYNPEISKTPYSNEQANELLDKTWTRLSAEEYRIMRRDNLIKEWQKNLKNITTAEDTADNGQGAGEQATSTISDEDTQAINRQLDEEINDAQTFYRKNKDGDTLELKLVTIDTQEYRHAAEQIAGFWQEIGVKTSLEFVASKDLSREVLKNRSYDVLLYGVIIGSDPDQYPFWHSSQIDFPGLNLSRYADRNADALLKEAREAADEEAVIETYRKLQDIIIAEKPAIFLYMPTYTYATTEKIKGLDLSRIFTPADRFADVTSWYIKMEGQWRFN
ncbi:MAG: peptide ABC transporter substrate-binding protein [Patescibacteria group bacterium]